MLGPQKPFVDIEVDGKPSGLVIGPALKEFVYRDVHHGAVDEISLKLADPNGLWRSSWGIDEGVDVAASMGYAGLLGAVVPCGLYQIGETEAEGDGSGSTASFHGQSAFTSKELRTARSQAHEQRSLAEIIKVVADRHDLQVLGETADLRFQRVSQDKESDLAFLTRLAEDWGHYFSIKGDQLVFTTRKSIEDTKPVRIFDLFARDPVTRWRARKSTNKLYHRATVKYLHPASNRLLSAEAKDERVPSGDTLKLDDRAETQAHAEHLCAARLARANDGLGTGRITTVGDPLLLSGQIIELAPSYGRYAGRWLITAATHRFTSNGYTTSVDIKVI
ncbi:phage late control D family protein [Epibacterium ulvae]|uniref:phage late control D family protein n=1 Tax=Epibacterium ulvae TaxID=1156985 RepID=UPI0024923D82|nr:contractile injection system protein, VgrG/Pvc8 family [Epibacterium ulvae]